MREAAISSGRPVTRFSTPDCTLQTAADIGQTSRGGTAHLQPPMCVLTSFHVQVTWPLSAVPMLTSQGSCTDSGRPARGKANTEGTWRIRCRGEERIPRPAPTRAVSPSITCALSPVPRTRCYRLNAVSLKFLCGNPNNPQWDCMRTWGLKEVIRSQR